MILTEHTTQRLFTLTLREDGSLLIIEVIKAKNIQEATMTLLKKINQKYYKNSWKKLRYMLENIRDISITERLGSLKKPNTYEKNYFTVLT